MPTLKSYPEYKKQIKAGLKSLDASATEGKGHHLDFSWLAAACYESSKPNFQFIYPRKAPELKAIRCAKGIYDVFEKLSGNDHWANTGCTIRKIMNFETGYVLHSPIDVQLNVADSVQELVIWLTKERTPK